jgi:hypothetical protein
MPQCHCCSQSIPRGSGVKKTVYPGASVGGFNFSSRVWLNVVLNSVLGGRRSFARSYYSQQWVCTTCAAKIDAKEKIKLLLIVVGIFAVISFFAISIALRH